MGAPMAPCSRTSNGAGLLTVDLLPDRTADTFAAWLVAHPGVEVISRDRAGAYAEGARRGAPHAVQVADRFHIVKNLGENVEQVVTRHHAAVREANKALAPVPPPPSVAAAPGTAVDSPLARPTRIVQRQQARRAHRVARYEEVIALDKEGHSQRTIARTLGIARETVQRYLQADGFPERKQRAPRTALDAPYESYLRQRWDAGCQTV